MFFVPIPRKIAIERGLTHFFSKKPCKSGNFIHKKVIRGACCPCSLCMDIKRERERKYQKINLNKKLEYNRQYRKNNWEQVRNYEQKYLKNNKNKRNEYLKKYRQTEARKKVRRNHYINNKHNLRSYAIHRKYLSQIFKDELSLFVAKETYNLCILREKSTNIKWQLDHMIPLLAENTSGLHIWNNFQCLPQTMNASKQNKLIYTNPHEWLYDIPKFFKVVYQQEIAA